MPVSWASLFRLLVLLVMAAHVFYLYAFARTQQEIIGLDFFAILASSSFSLVMLVPLAWAVALPDLPEIIRSQRNHHRWAQGECARCGYPVLHARGGACPECGADRNEPKAFWLGWATARRFALLAAVAWLVGCLAAESWAEVDESSFAREAVAHLEDTRAGRYSRPRIWPMQNMTLYYNRMDGVTAYSPEMILPPISRVRSVHSE